MNRITRFFCLVLALLLALTAPALAFEELSKGSKGDAVVELQNKLNELGYSVGTADGDFGGKTVAALQQFQTDNGLEVTGILDEATYNVLFGTGIKPLTENKDAKIIDAWPMANGMCFWMNDGTVIWSEPTSITGNPAYAKGNRIRTTDVVSVAKDGGTNPILFHSDGSITTCYGKSLEFDNEEEWKDLVLAGASFSHAVGLKRDGTWISAGEYRNGECDVEGWTDIVQLQVGQNYTVGLKADGTVVATGENGDGRCNVSQWTDIVKISVYKGTQPSEKGMTLGLKSDGTVVVAGGDNKSSATFVGRWSNVIDICAGVGASYGLRADGRILSTSDELYDYVPKDYTCENAIGILGDYCGDAPILVIKADNTVEAFGKDADVFNSYLNGAEIRINDANSKDAASSDDAELNAEMAALLEAFKDLGEGIDTNGDGQVTIDEIFN